MTLFSIDRVAFTIFGKDIYWYSISLAVAVLTVLLMCCHRGKKAGYKDDIFIDLCFIILVSGVIGARILYVLNNLDSYKSNPISVLYIWEGGLAILGGFITALPCIVLYCYKKKINLWHLVDLIVPCLALAQCIGRWGNFFNQELYGPVVTDPSWQFFPFAVFIDKTQSWHMATFFYESLWNFGAFVVLSVVYFRKHDNGDVFFLYIILYAIIRIILDEIKIEGTLANQLISLGLAVIVVVLYLVKKKMYKDEKFSQMVHKKVPAFLLPDYVPQTAEADVNAEDAQKAEDGADADKE